MDAAKLIKKVTTPPKNDNPLEVSDESLKVVKSACKQSPEIVQEVFYYLSIDLSKRNGAVRYRALTVMDCLLHRSKAFRELVCSDIRTIVGHMGLLKSGTNDTDHVSLSSIAYGVEVEAKGKELVELWDHLYGERYPQLRAVARYLREFLGIAMPDILANAQLHAERTERNRQHTRNVVLLRTSQVLQDDWNFYMPEWRKSVLRLQEMFQLLFPGVGADSAAADVPTGEDGDEFPVDWVNEEDEEANEVVAEEGGLQSAVGAPYTLAIRLATTARDLETPDNAILLQHVREIAKHLVKTAVPRLRQWRDLLTHANALYNADSLPATAPAAVSPSTDRTTAAMDALVDGEGETTPGAAPPGASLLGKRHVGPAEHLDTAIMTTISSSAASSALHPEVSTAMVGARVSRARVAQCLTEVEELLEEVHLLLTGRVRALLQGEAL